MIARIILTAIIPPLVATSGPARAADLAPLPRPVVTANDIARIIDRHLEADWRLRGITPAARAEDGEFCRRVHLDLIGRTPKVAEIRQFLDDTDPRKREKLVERLLKLPSFAANFAAVTRVAWVPQSATNQQFAFFGSQFEVFLRNRFRENTPADEVVRRVVAARFFKTKNIRNNFSFVQPDPDDPESSSLLAFYQANESKPENLGSAVSRLFLGIKLECAQCHDHPFAPYTKEQFWEFAAFFADLNPLPATRPSEKATSKPQADKNRLFIPGTDTEVVARFFDGADPKWSADRTPRQELANWLTRPENPYFARNLANRMWAHFFGLGLIEPVDEPSESNPPSHPRLLEELGRAFVAARFNNRVLIQGIVQSRAYQLTSQLSHPTQADPRRFARMNVKGLTPGQLFDSLVAATGYRENPQFKRFQFAFFPRPNNPRSMFLARFASTDKPTETSTTILQALMMMNGNFVEGQTAPDRGEILGALLDYPGWGTRQRVEAVFLTALARKPSSEELQKYSSYVDRGGPTGDKKKALGDVFWVLLNTPEFLFNH